jgi:hypothetical protein
MPLPFVSSELHYLLLKRIINVDPLQISVFRLDKKSRAIFDPASLNVFKLF